MYSHDRQRKGYFNYFNILIKINNNNNKNNKQQESIHTLSRARKITL